MGEWVKIVGSVIVIGTSLYYGISLGKELEKRCEEYENLKFLLATLDRNCRFYLEPYPTLFHALAKQILTQSQDGTIVGENMMELAKQLPEMEFQTGWKHFVNAVAKRIGMNDGIKQQLFNLGNCLQSMDVESVDRQIEAVVLLLDAQIHQLRTELRERKKVRMSCSLMVGLFTVIILF